MHKILLLLALMTLKASADPIHVLAYYTPDAPATKALKARHTSFDQLGMDCFGIEAIGRIHGSAPAADLAFAHEQKLETFATVSNYAGKDFSPEIAHAVITSPAATQKFIDESLKILAAGHFTALNIDFESIPAKDRAAFSAFIATVSDKIHQAGYLSIVSVPATATDDPTNSWTGAFDFKALGASADLLQVMTYDQNGSWGPAGPIAGLDWVEAAIRLVVAVVPSNKISLGVPAFAYDWDLTDSHKNFQTIWADMPALIAKMHGEEHWDDASSSPNFTYTKGGHKHIVWYENEKSIALKAKLVATYKLAGASVWELGQEDASFWTALHSGGF